MIQSLCSPLWWSSTAHYTGTNAIYCGLSCSVDLTAITSYIGVPYEILLGKEYIPRIPGVACPCIMCCGSSRFPGSPLQPSNNNMGILYTLGTARDITGLTMFPNPEFYSRRNNTLSANFDYSNNWISQNVWPKLCMWTSVDSCKT